MRTPSFYFPYLVGWASAFIVVGMDRRFTDSKYLFAVMFGVVTGTVIFYFVAEAFWKDWYDLWRK